MRSFAWWLAALVLAAFAAVAVQTFFTAPDGGVIDLLIGGCLAFAAWRFAERGRADGNGSPGA